MEMTINQLMELTGKSFRTIKSRLTKVNPVREDGRAGHYDTKEALSAIYGFGQELAKENLLLERARREKAEIEVKKLRGESLPIEMVSKTLGRQISNFRAHVRSLPSRMAKPLSMISDPHEVHSRLAESIDEFLTELTADADYQLEAERIRSSRPVVVEDDLNELQTDAEIESSRVGGYEATTESGVEQHTGPLED